MAREIKAGVQLNLKDQFSPGIKNAGNSVKGFKDKAVFAAHAIDQAFSSLGAQLASLGVTIGAAALINTSIDYEDAIIRIGTNAGMIADETNRLRRKLLETATAEKIQVKELESFASTLANNAVGFDVISDSAGFAAQAIQGLGITGVEAADLLSVLVNRGADVDTFKEKMNNLAEIDDRLQGMGLTEFTRYIPQLMELSGAGVDGIEDLYLSILTLNNGATDKKAITQYTSAMQDFASSRDKIRRSLGFDTKSEKGELKSFAEIMEFLVTKANKWGDYDKFGKAFDLSDATIMAMKQFNNHYQETISKVGELGDTSDAVSRRADQNARSLKSALTGLHDSILAQADGALTEPIEKLAKLLNEHPEGLKNAIEGVGLALAVLATMKAFSTVVTFIGSLKSLFEKKGGDLGELANAGGSAGIPVHVTNWGGGVLPQGLGGGTPPLLDQFGNPLARTAVPPRSAAPSSPSGGGIPGKGNSSVGLTQIAGFMAIATLINDKVFMPIAQWGHSKLEKIDPAVPGVSNYYNLNPRVRKRLWDEYNASHGIPPLTSDDSQEPLPVKKLSWRESFTHQRQRFGRFHAADLPPQITQTVSSVTPKKVELDGKAEMVVKVEVSGASPAASVTVRNNTMPFRFFETGRSGYARMLQ